MEWKFSSHVCASICPNLYILLLLLLESPMCDRDNKPVLCFKRGTQKPQSEDKKKKWNCREVLGNSAAFLITLSFDMPCEWKKRRRHCWWLPFPKPEYKQTYFHTVSAAQWGRSPGSAVLFLQTIAGPVWNRLGTLGSWRTGQRKVCRQQKTPPCTLIPFIWVWNKRGRTWPVRPAASSGTLSCSVWLSLISEHHMLEALFLRHKAEGDAITLEGLLPAGDYLNP